MSVASPFGSPDLPARISRRTALLVGTAVLLSGCATGGSAVTTGDTFAFVAPGGQTTIFYDPPADRGRVGPMSATSVDDAARTISLNDFAGQVVALNVWGSWCPPCREEAPGLQQVYDTTRDAGVTVLGIAVRDDRTAARDFLRDRGFTYPSLFDESGRTLLALEGFPRNVVPSTIVLDRGHRVAAVFLAAVRVGELLPVVQRLAAEPVDAR